MRMKRILMILNASVFALALCAKDITYTPDDVSIFPNPERGFTEELGGEHKLTDSKNHVVKPEADWFFDLEDPENEDRKTQTLVMLMYYLYNYRTKDLTNKILTGFDEDMQILRDHGFKCVLRFAYDWNSKKDADVEQAKKHISQLKPYLEKNKDVIYVLEAGFVGRWGEWYYSEHYDSETQHLTAGRRQILEAMLNACPAGRFLLVRYPMIKTEYLGEQVAVTADEAYSSSPRARIGYHNDAFLNIWGNDGTYASDDEDDDPQVRQYIADETLYVPNGGETNVEDNEDTPGLPEQVYNKAEEEMAKYHWSFCGSTYSEEVTDRWRTHGIFDELNRKMGYRYQLVTATLPDEAIIGGQVNIRMQIKNVGYAPLYNERHAYIVLSDGSKTYSLALQSDPRRWLPNGAVTTIDEQLTIPAEVPAGTYQLYLHLPDAAASLAADPRYAVRFANVGTWDATTGMNSLQAEMTVTTTEDINQTETAPQVQKILRDGQLLIRKGEKIFTVQGSELF